jgi:transposase
MRLHANARLSVKGRELLIDRVEVAGWSLTTAAEAAGVSERTAAKWLARFRAEGPAGLSDRSSAPRTVPNRTARTHDRGDRRAAQGPDDGGGDR